VPTFSGEVTSRFVGACGLKKMQPEIATRLAVTA
jgi:hypothetical protein